MSNRNAPPIPGIEHNSGDYAIVNADERLHYTTSQIQLWVGYLRLDSVLKVEELDQLSMIEKMVSLPNGLIVGAIRHCRLNPRTDSRMSVLTIITFLADNNEATEAAFNFHPRRNVTRMKTRVKCCVMWAFAWHVIKPRATQWIVDRLKLHEE
jgi:hypothetical protein